MGYKTEINYIAKYSSGETQVEFESIKEECKKEGDSFLEKNERTIVFSKSGLRTYVLNSPIFLANHKWEVIGRGVVKEVLVNNQVTTITFRILNIYNQDEIKLISDIIQRGEQSHENSNR